MAAALPALVVTCLGAAFVLLPGASTEAMPASITENGVVYDRAELITFRTVFRDSVTVRIPVTTRPIVVRGSCTLARLHGSHANSALLLDVPTSYVDGRNVPETNGADVLHCFAGRPPDLTTTIDPGWLPREGDRLRLTWTELDTRADAPADSPASWALAVYVAR
ncbi:hypothetical protein GCM10009681_31690 [Luedemannella helvata]|uniref:Uncharacterized protein n=1 Tax=Luedemannella helvata TaxID=349315 RepID=A0ABN2KL58_9ACTN